MVRHSHTLYYFLLLDDHSLIPHLHHISVNKVVFAYYTPTSVDYICEGFF